MAEDNSNNQDSEAEKFKVTDRRHWTLEDKATAEEAQEQVPSYVQQLKSEADDKDNRLREYIAAYKAKSAEIEEVKQRLQRENQAKLDQFKAKFFAELLRVFDNLMRAAEAGTQGVTMESLNQGIQMTLEQFKSQLEKNGVTSIQAVGRKFDPSTDEACMTVPTDDPDQDNMVLEELEPGYLFGEKLLRPVKVKVARAN